MQGGAVRVRPDSGQPVRISVPPLPDDGHGRLGETRVPCGGGPPCDDSTEIPRSESADAR
jgi:hypothetical protein